MGVRQGKQGGQTGSVETSPERAKRIRRAKKRQEERWARKSSEVTTKVATPEEIAALLNQK